MKKNNIVVFLMGPTCSGKTALAMKIYDEINARIISVDSSMVYKNMNIGTAKPNEHELKKFPHKLVDIINPNQCYSVANFYYDSLREIELSFLEKRIPLLVGGTMLYYKILLNGLLNLPKRNKHFTRKIFLYVKNYGSINLYNKLQKIDSKSANNINKNDIYRLSRALEVYYSTGKKKVVF
ncbi:MAG: hypothetical protein BucCj_3660 [Buchnera aphidicola (Ceratovacuna japonica)]